MSSNSSSAVSGIAYQSIIIALIAGGILTIGVVSILWRRRSQRSWMAMRSDAHLPLGMGMGFGTDFEGREGNGPGGRRRGKKLGKAPEVWDALIGPRQGEEEKEAVNGDHALRMKDAGHLEEQVGDSWCVSVSPPRVCPVHYAAERRLNMQKKNLVVDRAQMAGN